MGQLLAHEFMSLDGVVETPMWTAEFGFPDDLGADLGAVTASATAILLGRVTYEMFEPAWSGRTVDDDPGAPFFNDTTKHVVSTTLTNPTWRNTTVVPAYGAGAVRDLKDSAGGDVYLSGSVTLVRALLADGLVDQLHLFLYPVVLGSGLRLFGDGSDRTTLSLVSSETFTNGVVHLVYGPATGQ